MNWRSDGRESEGRNSVSDYRRDFEMEGIRVALCSEFDIKSLGFGTGWRKGKVEYFAEFGGCIPMNQAT